MSTPPGALALGPKESWFSRYSNLATITTTVIGVLIICFQSYGSYAKLEQTVTQLSANVTENKVEGEKLSQKLEQHVQDTTHHLDPVRDPQTQSELREQMKELRKQMESLTNQIFQLNNELRLQRR